MRPSSFRLSHGGGRKGKEKNNGKTTEGDDFVREVRITAKRKQLLRIGSPLGNFQR